jgi:hypothetical protein
MQQIALLVVEEFSKFPLDKEFRLDYLPPLDTASSLFRPRRFASANGGVF